MHMRVISLLVPSAGSCVQARYNLPHAAQVVIQGGTGNSQLRPSAAGAGAVVLHRRCSGSGSRRRRHHSWRSPATRGVVGRDEVEDGDAVVYGGVLCGRRSVVRAWLLLHWRRRRGVAGHARALRYRPRLKHLLHAPSAQLRARDRLCRCGSPQLRLRLARARVLCEHTDGLADGSPCARHRASRAASVTQRPSLRTPPPSLAQPLPTRSSASASR